MRLDLGFYVGLTFGTLVAGTLIVSAQTHYLGETMDGASLEQKGAYCQGFTQAMEMLRQSRNHYRSLLGYPVQTQEEVLDWIYARPWKDDATHRTAPRRLSYPDGEPQVGPPAVESIDLYLMPGVTGCVVDGKGAITFQTLDWSKVR